MLTRKNFPIIIIGLNILLISGRAVPIDQQSPDYYALHSNNKYNIDHIEKGSETYLEYIRRNIGLAISYLQTNLTNALEPLYSIISPESNIPPENNQDGSGSDQEVFQTTSTTPTTRVMSTVLTSPPCLSKADPHGISYSGTVNAGELVGVECLYWDDLPKDIAGKYKLIPEGQSHNNYCRNLDNDPRGPWCYISPKDAELHGGKNFQYCEIPSCEQMETEPAETDNAPESSLDEASSDGSGGSGSGQSEFFDDGRIGVVMQPEVDFADDDAGVDVNAEDESVSSVTATSATEPNLPSCLPEADPLGNSYIGTVSAGELGLQCLYWDALPEVTGKYKLTQETSSGHNNYCRNLDNDPRGPWCYISLEDAEVHGKNYQYCAIPVCGTETEIDEVGDVGESSEISEFYDDGRDESASGDSAGSGNAGSGSGGSGQTEFFDDGRIGVVMQLDIHFGNELESIECICK